MPATIRELINQNVRDTIALISTDTGYANNVGVVEWAKATGNPQTFPDVNKLHVVLHDEGDAARESSPISKDDYEATITIQVFFTQSVNSDTGKQDRNASVWGDLKKAMSQDYRRGTHPTNGGALAFNTTIAPPVPFDVPEAQGLSAEMRIWYRTAKDNPYAQ